MQPPSGSSISLEVKVVVLALCVAVLTSAGNSLQKLNGLREGGNPVVSVWLVLSTACFFPAFVITNKAFLMGGRMSLFVPATATTYVLSMLVGRFLFGEAVSLGGWLGCLLIVAGVAAIARG